MPDPTVPDSPRALALVTGATSGLGVHIADALEARGLRVLRPALDELDLSSLDSVRRYSDLVLATGHPLAVLVLNAGVYAPPSRIETPDGFELQWQVNLLGHAALTAHLLPSLRAVGGRVVSQTSFSAKSVTLDFADLQSTRDYRPVTAYARSKLAIGLFGLELDRRSREAGWGVSSALAHPGVASTNVFNASGYSDAQFRQVRMMARLGLFNTAERGAAPAILAATAPDAGGQLFGPRGLGETSGAPRRRALWSVLEDPESSARLWDVLQEQARIAF